MDSTSGEAKGKKKEPDAEHGYKFVSKARSRAW